MLFKGKTMEEAVKSALETLKISEDEADIQLIDTEVKRGLFGKEKKIFTVSVEQKSEEDVKKLKIKKDAVKKEQSVKKEEKPEKKSEPKKEEKAVQIDEKIEKAKDFVVNVYSKLGVEITAEITSLSVDGVVITVDAKDSAQVIGHRGEILDSIQSLAGAIANSDRKEHLRIVIDCEGYRKKREETLISLAKRTADKACERERKIALEPMSAYERRVIHSALIGDDRVTTTSDGKEPNRYIIIVPKTVKDGKVEFGGRRKDDNKKGGKQRRQHGRRPEGKNTEIKSLDKKQITFGTFLGNSLEKKD